MHDHGTAQHQALAESRSFTVRPIPVLRPLGWLARGWRDLMRCPAAGLAARAGVALFGGLLIAVAHRSSSGC
jgi:hypothetical protein